MKCKECNNQVIVSGFESFCKNCGLVAEDQPLSDSVGFTNQKLPTFSVGGKNTFKLKVAKNVILANKKEVLFFELRKDLERIVNLLRLPKFIINNSLKLLQRVIKENLCQGRDYDVIIACCILFSAKMSGINVDLIKLADYSIISLRSLIALSAKLSFELDLGLDISFSLVKEYLIDLFDKKIIDGDVLKECLVLVPLLEKIDFSERLKAFCISFIVLNKRECVSLEEFCNKVGVSMNCLLEAYHKINGGMLLEEWQKKQAFI